jgi:hypothetical protein
MTLGSQVEAMATAYRRVIDAKGLIKSHEDVRVRLDQMGQIEAAEAAKLWICHLELRLKRLEVMLVVASHSLRNAFDASTAPNPSSSPNHMTTNTDLGKQVLLGAPDL